MFRKLLDYAEAGDNIGALLRGVAREEMYNNVVVDQAAPGSITPHTESTSIRIIKKTRCMSHTPFFSTIVHNSISVLLT